MAEAFEYEVVTSAPVEEIVELYRAGGWWQESPANRGRIEPMIRGSFCFIVARTAAGKIVAMGRVISDSPAQPESHSNARSLKKRHKPSCRVHPCKWMWPEQPASSSRVRRLSA